MPAREIIVIGGSAGSLDAIRTLVAGLPADLPAAVFVTVHITDKKDGAMSALLLPRKIR